MTVLGSRVGMIHTCDIQRASGAADSWGQSPTNYTTVHAGVICRAWTTSESLVNEADALMTLAARYIAFPLGTDVLETDRIGDISDRTGVLWQGPHVIDAVVKYPDRIEVTLREAE